MDFIITCYFFIIFLLSGLSLHLGDRVSYYLILILPFILYFYLYVNKVKLSFPNKLLLAWLGFSLFDLTSSTLSTDKQLSIERFLLYQSLFMVAIFVFNKKSLIKPLIEKLIIIFSFVFIFAFIFKDIIIKFPAYFDVNELFNFYHPVIKNNNHLGIWLGMAILILLSWKKNLSSFLLTPFFLISYSRTAFVGFFTVICTWVYGLKKKHLLILPVLLISIFVFILSVVIFVPRDDILSDRVYLYKEAILGFFDRPIFGYGSGNFTEASLKRSLESNGVANNNSHNIFLDVLVESGIFAFIFFATFIYLVLKGSKQGDSKSIFIYLLICATLSYINKMPVFMLLFFVYAGLTYEEKEKVDIKWITLIWVTALFLVSSYLGYSEYLYIKENFDKSLRLYPYRKEAYEKLVSQIIYSDTDKAKRYLNLYEKHFPGVFNQVYFSADIYQRIGNNDKALIRYMSLYETGIGFNPSMVLRIHNLYLIMGRSVESYYFTKGFVNKVMIDPKKYKLIYDGTYELCIYINRFFLDKPACF